MPCNTFSIRVLDCSILPPHSTILGSGCCSAPALRSCVLIHPLCFLFVLVSIVSTDVSLSSLTLLPVVFSPWLICLMNYSCYGTFSFSHCDLASAFTLSMSLLNPLLIRTCIHISTRYLRIFILIALKKNLLDNSNTYIISGPAPLVFPCTDFGLSLLHFLMF